MELWQMRYVLAVAEQGNLRRAASTLHLAMQSLSEQVRSVERELGVPLFVRSRAGMTLTAAGEAFVAQATIAVDAAGRVATAARAAGSAEPVRIAVSQGRSALAGLLLRRYLLARPEDDVRIADLGTVSQLDALQDGRVVAGLAYAPPPLPRGIASVVLRSEPVMALLPAGEPLAAQEEVTLEQLSDLPLLLPAAEDAAGLRDRLLAAFAARSLTPRLGPAVQGQELAIASVATGRGYTLCVPSLPRPDDALVLRPLADPVPPLTSHLLVRRDERSPATLELLAAAHWIAAQDPAMHERRSSAGVTA